MKKFIISFVVLVSGLALANQWPDHRGTLLGATPSAGTIFPSLCNGSGANSTCYGVSATATASRSGAFGDTAASTAADALAIGANTIANQVSTTAVGIASSATGAGGTALGQTASASGIHGVALGGTSQATALESLAFGYGAISNANGSVAIGGGVTTNGFTNCVGLEANCSANNYFEIGSTSTPLHPVYAAGTLTAGTMTASVVSQLRHVVSKYSWTNAMVTALGASLTGDVAVATLPAKTIVTNAYVVIDTACGGTATLTVAIGRTGAAYDDYITAQDAQAAANTVYGDSAAERGINLTGYDLPSYTGTTTINAHFISTVNNLSSATTCTGSIYLETELLP